MAVSRMTRYPRKRRYVRKRRAVKRTYPKRRTYTRRPRTMGRKKILNITSEKKKDDMLVYTNVVSPRNQGNTTFTTDPARLIGGSSEEYAFMWCATGRDNSADFAGARGTKFYEATRTSSLCYMRGLKEKIEIITTTGLPWQWRRICFTQKGAPPTSTSSFAVTFNTSSGYVRVVNEAAATVKTQLYNLIFDGTQGTDWRDPMIAKVDTSRVTIKYDHTCTIATGNQNGMIRTYNKWHPMNKNLRYDDDENGGNMTTSAFSVTAKQGMGDYYVIDIFRPLTGSTSTDVLTFAPQATLYWHEK